MAVTNEPYRPADFTRGGKALERDKGATILDDPLRQYLLAGTTREGATGTEIVQRAIAGDGRIQT